MGKKSLKMQNLKDTEPKWSKHDAQLTFSTKNTNKWVNILASRYYNNIDPETNNVVWNDIFDRLEVDVVESQVNITTSANRSISICIFFTTNTIRIQGISIKEWEKEEYPGLKQLYDNAPNIPEDIDRMCEGIFKEDTGLQFSPDLSHRMMEPYNMTCTCQLASHLKSRWWCMKWWKQCAKQPDIGNH